MSQEHPAHQDTLEEAADALRAAERSVREARRRLSTAIVAAYQLGDSIATLASRTGEDPHQIRNLLTAAGVRRRS
ncbi:helix-turn-helix domain-containing protein [Streptomyces sp. NPDC090442]|uniref:helix-turn-helix domain-containing protein n=1 Tax=Streptomyces sp. NPDC090442 TaxID=3365962 RepID=UPI003800ABDC